MKIQLRALFLSFFILLFLTSNSYGEAKKFTGNINYIYGYTSTELNYLDKYMVDDQVSHSFNIDFKKTSFPFHLTIGHSVAKGYNSKPIASRKTTSLTKQTYLGIRKIWDNSPTLRPFISVGIAETYIYYTNTQFIFTNKFDDSSLGLWLDTGMYGTIKDHLNIGFKIKYTQAQEIGNESVGIFEGGVLIGYHL